MNDEERRTVEITIRATPQETYEFFERLARDDDFRADLEENPQKVLREYHIEISEDALPALAELPSKEDVETFLSEVGDADELATRRGIPLGYSWFVASLGGAMPLVAGDGDGAHGAR